MQPSDRNIHKFFPIKTLMHTNTSSIKLLYIITWKQFNYHKTNDMHACHSSCLFVFLVLFVVLRLPRELNPGLVRVPRELNPALFVCQGNLTPVLFVSCSMLMHKYFTFKFMDMTLTHALFIKYKQFNMSFSQTICVT
jgi:hypothetical protein